MALTCLIKLKSPKIENSPKSWNGNQHRYRQKNTGFRVKDSTGRSYATRRLKIQNFCISWILIHVLTWDKGSLKILVNYSYHVSFLILSKCLNNCFQFNLNPKGSGRFFSTCVLGVFPTFRSAFLIKKKHHFWPWNEIWCIVSYFLRLFVIFKRPSQLRWGRAPLILWIFRQWREEEGGRN